MEWRCTVCGYIHKGESPPETCPVCGVSSDKFVLVEKLIEEEESLEKIETMTTDIISIGSGAAGLMVGITANQLELDVVILEKARDIGGTTARSGGRYWIPNNYAQKELGLRDDKEDCIKYMARYSFSHKYDKDKKYYGLRELEYKLLETYYDKAWEVVYLLKEEGIMESEVQINWKNKAEVDYLDTCEEQNGIRGRTIYPKTDKEGAVSGQELIDLLNKYLIEKDIIVRTNNRVEELIVEEDRVVGVIAKSKKGRQKIYARKGVVFGSGGFSHNPELMDRFQLGRHYGGCAVGENEGDIINMTETLGAKLGNMGGAFRVQSMAELYFDNPTGSSSVFYVVGDSVLQVNKYGDRVMNEKRNYTDRTMTHFYWDPVKGEWTNRFLFMIFDKRTAKYWAGFPPYPAKDIEKVSYIISGNNYDELGKNIEKRLEELGDKTGNFKLDRDFKKNLEKTINRFNRFAESGKDEDFNRGESPYEREIVSFPPLRGEEDWSDREDNVTMYPLSDEGPYYAIILGAGTLDTSGGPMTNEYGQILNYKDEVIRGLYGAGNCVASPSKNAYWGAGATIGPAMTFANIAVKHACEQEDNIKK